ncbi:MAG: hypothetical protein BWK80_23545 [Desulfobacteraceae bacterium IS3]|nr:MAG: hypothetical protein BWK80_23545 [Desulfobacteraceae bacterium IS3]
MSQFTFLDLAIKILEEEKKPLSIEEIWKIAITKGYDKSLRAVGKTPWQTLGARMYIDMKDNQNSIFLKVGVRPRRFTLKTLAQNQNNELDNLPIDEKKEKKEKKNDYLEKELHPFLVYFVQYAFDAYCKTITHSKSPKKEFGEWIHPDIVGCYFPFQDWKSEVIQFGSALGNVSVKLYSFEIKKELNFGNLREAFFQTVSNSSWAHEGYLVAADISADEDFISELQRLSTSFGIGIIKLDTEDADASKVVYPAKFKEYLDWDGINKLSINKDFKEFIDRITDDIKTQKVISVLYDKVYEKEELEKMITKS